MILAAHQPDLLPYTGFWHKMAKADQFVVLKDVAMNQDGYTRRVKMRDTWVSLGLESRHSGQLITEAVLRQDASTQLWRSIEGRYRGAKFWDARSKLVAEWIGAAADTRSMWQFNLSLLLSVRDWLRIRTPLVFPGPVDAPGLERLVVLCEELGADSYLAGTGSKRYLDEDGWELQRTAVKLQWSRHWAWSSDSVLSTVFSKEDPMWWVMAEDGDPGTEKVT